MSKYIIVSDKHLCGVNSINRIGNSWADSMAKEDEIISIAKENKINTIIDTGDTLHSPEISNNLLDEFIDKIEKAKLQYYFLHGNHSSLYRNVKLTSVRSSMAHAVRRSKNFHYFEDIDEKDYRVVGIDYYTGIEEDLKSGKLIDKLIFGNDKPTTILIHALVMEKPFLPQVSHVVYNEIDTDGDLVIISHLHTPYVHKHNNSIFLNIGCLNRRSITEKDIKPSCLILDAKNPTCYTLVNLKCAKEAKEVFNLEKIEEERKEDMDLTAFIDSLESFTSTSINLKDKILFLAKESKTEKEITEDIFNRLDKMECL